MAGIIVIDTFVREEFLCYIYILMSLSLLKRGPLGTFCAEVGVGRVL